MKLLKLYILSRVEMDEMVGFLSYLGHLDFEKATLLELGKVSHVPLEKLVWISGALEEFGFIQRIDGRIAITSAGKVFHSADPGTRKHIIRRDLEADECLGDFLRLVRSSKGHRVKRSQLLRQARRWFPDSGPESLLVGLITWGRSSDLLHYDVRSDEIFVPRDHRERDSVSASKQRRA